MTPTAGSLFSGIGGFDLGLERAGWEVRWQIENDAFCNQILERHWPGLRRYGDITRVDTNGLEPVDLLCGGFPCQDLSVAGARAGLAGGRSSLFFEFARIAAALRPRWILIENVPGLLSSPPPTPGRDFAVVLGTLAELGYGLAWRSPDSQYFGVAQRRERLYLVGHLGAPCPPEVLFEPESLRRDSPPSRESGSEVAGTLTPGAHTGGFNGQDAHQGNILSPALRTRHDSSSRDGQDIAFALTSYAARHGPEETYAIQDAGNLLKDQNGVGIAVGGPMYTLDGGNPHAVASAISARPYDDRGDEGDNIVVNGRQDPISSAGVSLPLDAGHPVHAVAATLPADRRIRSDGNADNLVIGASPDANGVREAPRVPGRLDTPDSPRYRALGNAVTVSVAEWFGRRILEAHQS